MRSAIAKLLLLVLALGSAMAAQDDTVMKAMRDEMERSKTQLHLAEMEKPYFVEYRVDDTAVTSIVATLGVLAGSNNNRMRTLTMQVRVGDYAFDNTNFLAVRSFGPGAGLMGSTRRLPLDDDYQQLRREIWLATDRAYKQAASGIAAKRSVLQTRKYSTNLPDFTAQKPVTMTEARAETKFDRAAAEKLARDLSAVFRDNADIIASEADFFVRDVYERYLNSEGTVFTRSEPLFAVRVQAHTLATDGLPLEDSFAVYGRSMEVFRSADLLERTRQLAARLVKLRAAGSLDRYNGPVLFEGEAAGAVVSDVFAPAVCAARFPLSDEPQFESSITQLFGQMGGTALTDKLGGRVMPEFLNLSDKPLLATFDGARLLGTHKIDDEGVPTQDLNIVEAGILRNVLATRTPTAESKASTGSKGLFGAVSSNLVLAATKSETTPELRQHLLRLAKARGYDFGIVVRHASEAGLSWITRFAGSMGEQTGLSAPSIEIYKVFADGHEEPVRGVELNGLTPASFKDIVAVGDKPIVYNGPHVPMMNAIFAGFGGASLTGDALALGSVVAPPILFEEVSLKKANLPAPNPPVVPSPLPSFTQR